MPGGDDGREVSWPDELDILPDQTRDDTDDGWGRPRRSRRDDDDRRLYEDRPPHWSDHW